MKKFVYRVLAPLILLALGASANAATYSVTGLVEDILVNDTNLGRCAVAIEGWGEPGNCGRRWISLDCSGDFIEKSTARSMLELAQIAKATAGELSVFVDDTTCTTVGA